MNKTQFTAIVRTILTEYRASDGAYYYTPELLMVCQRVHVDVMGSQEPDRNLRFTAVDLAWLLWRRETWKPSERPFDLAVLAVLDAVIVEALEKWCEEYEDLEAP